MSARSPERLQLRFLRGTPDDRRAFEALYLRIREEDRAEPERVLQWFAREGRAPEDPGALERALASGASEHLYVLAGAFDGDGLAAFANLVFLRRERSVFLPYLAARRNAAEAMATLLAWITPLCFPWAERVVFELASGGDGARAKLFRRYARQLGAETRPVAEAHLIPAVAPSHGPQLGSLHQVALPGSEVADPRAIAAAVASVYREALGDTLETSF